MRPIGNALDYLTSQDAVLPTVDANGFRFRPASSESASANVTTNPFFGTFPNGAPFVGALAGADGGGSGSTDIDVISNVYDQVVANGRHVAPKSVSFLIDGASFSTQGDTTGWVTPFNFTGEFLDGQNYSKFRTVALIRTIYEYDTHAQSKEGVDYYYILTNYDGDTTTDANDSAHSWQSNVARTSAQQWYNTLAQADRATFNANSKFRDGMYQLTVRAKDASDNQAVDVGIIFVLVNFQRSFTGFSTGSTTVQIDPNPNYLANDAVPIYELTRRPVDGMALTNLARTISTDANGAMITTTMNFTNGHWYVADYDHDGVYYSSLDKLLVLHAPPPLVATSVGHSGSRGTLTSAQVNGLLPEAVRRWQSAGVDVSALAGIDVRIADLGGRTLGLADENQRRIWLDDNAAGWGWFVDSTPSDDSEFTTPGNRGEKNRIDLLTVIEHELGHLLGKEHEETGVMIDTLSAGTRRSPGSDLTLSDFTNSDWLSAWTEWELSSLHKTRTDYSTT